MDKYYGLNASIMSLAVSNELVITMNKACYKLGMDLKPFCLYATDKQKEFGVVDFALFDGLGGTDTLINEIVNYRKDVIAQSGVHVDITDEVKKKLLFYNYLMSISVCYVEIPKYVTKDGMPMSTYDKFLCTRNPSLMATWMGDTQNAMQAKYSHRLKLNQLDCNENLIRCVKLNQSSKGNSIILPRTAYSVEKMTCIPLFMLTTFIKGFRDKIENGIVEFSYLKDNGTIRTLATTLNSSILLDYYKDNAFVSQMLGGIDIDSVKQGALNVSSKIHRGYIKVPEVGASIYDGSGCRSLNIARLLSARVVNEVDRRFINADLNSVVYNFKNTIDTIVAKNKENAFDTVAEVYQEVTGKEIDLNADLTSLVSDLYYDVDSKDTFLSTQFKRSLHIYMLERPHIFTSYIGAPIEHIMSSSTVGVTIGDTIDFF